MRAWLWASNAGVNAGSGAVASIVVTFPGGFAQNDIMLVALAVDQGSGITITPPAGYTLIRRDDSTTDISLAWYYHVAGASESNPTFTFSPNARAGFITALIRGAEFTATTPVDDNAGQNNASGTGITCPAASIRQDAELLIAGVATLAKTTFTTPAGWNLTWAAPVQFPAASQVGSLALFHKTRTLRSAGNDLQVTAADAAVNVGAQVSLVESRALVGVFVTVKADARQLVRAVAE